VFLVFFAPYSLNLICIDCDLIKSPYCAAFIVASKGSSKMSTEAMPDRSQDRTQQIRASVLHGAKDLRIVSFVIYPQRTFSP
jgi:hypothetical protein